MKKQHIPFILGTALSAALSLGTTNAAVVAQFSFENNLNDSAAGGATADNLTYIQGASTSLTATYTAGVPGLGGSAGVFDGNYFSAADSNDLDITTDWTIETFISISTPNVISGWERTVVKWGASNDYHYGLRNGGLNLFDSGASERVAANTGPATNFADGDWHHIAITSSAAGAEAWIDGVSVYTGGAITLVAGTDALGLGDFATVGADNTLRLHGKLDEVLIHNSAVDQTYIDGRAALLVPEPSTTLFFGLAGLALALRRRR